MPTITPEVQKQLYQETDARFAAKTGIARKLDPKNRLDQKYIPQWMAIYEDVKKQYLAGVIAWTHDHPSVAPILTQASVLSANAATSLDAAQKAKANADHAAASQNAQDAHAAMTQAAEFMQRAKHLVRDLIASGSPVASAVASGIGDQALAQQIAATSQAVAAPGAQPVIQDTADVVTAMQGAAAPAHHDPASIGAPGWGGIDANTHQIVSPSSPSNKDIADRFGPPPFNMKAALGIGAAVAFLGGVAFLASHASSPKRARGRGSRTRTTVVRYKRARR